MSGAEGPYRTPGDPGKKKKYYHYTWEFTDGTKGERKIRTHLPGIESCDNYLMLYDDIWSIRLPYRNLKCLDCEVVWE